MIISARFAATWFAVSGCETTAGVQRGLLPGLPLADMLLAIAMAQLLGAIDIAVTRAGRAMEMPRVVARPFFTA
eukprot:1954353-Lingulodinium_polyedra.AAC.1